MKIQEIEALELRLAQNPKESNWKKLFSAMYYMGELQLRELGAIKEGESSLQIPQDNPYAWFATGRYAALCGAWANAVDVYDRALALRPQDVPTMLWKAEAMARLGRLDEASALFEHVGKTFAWPSRITRMGDEAWETIKKQAPAPIDESQWEWLVSPPKDVGTVVLVSLDGRYAHRYAESFLESWKALQKQVLAIEDRASNISGALHLHLHLVNADTATRELVRNWVLAAGQASLAYEEISLPTLVQDDEINHAVEARTWYACARVRILPWWVGRAKDGVLITDVDVHFLRSPLELWSALGQGSAGAVRFNPSNRMLWEEWYMTLLMVRATPKGQEVANDLAAYVSYFLDRGDGFWVLDQAALWSVFAKHGGPIGHALPTRPDVVPLAANLVRHPSSPAHPEAVIETSVASQQGNDLSPSQSPKTTEFSKALTYAQMWHRVMGQSLQKVQQEWQRAHGNVVVAGPFSGMTYHSHSHEGCYLPKVIGTYEAEIHPFLQDTAQKQPYRKLLNIGCADGYYAVGLARLSPQLQVWACDANPQAIEATQMLAQKNGVSDRITLEHKTFTPLDFATQVEPNTLVFMDIEGGEELLLSSDALAALATADLMIEVHDCYVPGLSERLCARLEKTHQVHLLKRQDMQLSLPPEMGNWSDWDRLMAVWEMRIGPTPWLLAKARTSAPIKPRQPRRKK